MDRRTFLASAGGGLALAALGACSPVSEKPRRIPIGLQLYTLNAELQKDFEGTLQKVAAIGVRDVELIKFPGRKSSDIARTLRSLDLNARAIHVSADILKANIQRELDEASELGVEYLVAPTPGTRDSAKRGPMTLDDWRWNADLFNKLGDQAQKSKIQFGFHNHNGEFAQFDGIVAYDELLKLTDPKLVTMELDCGWAESSGVSAARYLHDYPGRFRLLHIKDIKKRAQPGARVAMLSTEVGNGVVDWTTIFTAAKQGGVQYCFIEQEPPFERPAIDSVRMSYEWLLART